MSVEYVEIGPLADLGGEERLLLQVDEHEILLLQKDGVLHAIENRCSHDGQTFGDAAIEQGEIICPRHGAHFDLNSGDALSLPAVAPVRVYPVKVEAGVVYLGIPD